MTQVQAKVDFAAQLAPDVLESLYSIAREEGRQIHAVLDEALREYIEHKHATPRSHVLSALKASMTEYDALYQALAK